MCRCICPENIAHIIEVEEVRPWPDVFCRDMPVDNMYVWREEWKVEENSIRGETTAVVVQI